ncbi:MAG: hypothetical protein IJP72_03245, partial [Bacteroidales bacterium]|nr:hypothetical protein [Bacteroidales bacterium]
FFCQKNIEMECRKQLCEKCKKKEDDYFLVTLYNHISMIVITKITLKRSFVEFQKSRGIWGFQE